MSISDSAVYCSLVLFGVSLVTHAQQTDVRFHNAAIVHEDIFNANVSIETSLNVKINFISFLKFHANWMVTERDVMETSYTII